MNIFIALIFLLGAARTGCGASLNLNQSLPEVHNSRFYYFAFGSNMLAQRIHIQNPTAEIVGPVTLENYRLDFATLPFDRWDGAVATIVPTEGSILWGTLWEIDVINLADIDNQEGVHLQLYRPITVHVKLHGNDTDTEIPARAYVLVHQPENNVHAFAPNMVPEDRQPSKTYLQVLVKGAIESGIPESYIKFLRSIKHNRKTVKKLEQALQVQSVDL
ncbi:gamma-glutamylcyclotransferase-like [Drosophila novamexicana]|uniref:gamma-glutamylcyclotransferase-like n=1 Tax=Drosophila novamexicana TaxID=47314 RepID=UPI0011E58D1D|nr:gamma-glutamylcyclotransferase-like [Drosophila novamexicana]